MKTSNDPDPNWEPCHPGVLHEAAEESFSRRRLLQLIGSGAGLAIVGGGAYLGMIRSKPAIPNPNELPEGLACITVHEHLIAYVADKIPDPKLEKRIFKHLTNCPGCRTAYEELVCGITSGCESRPKNVTVRPPCHHHAPSP